MPLIYASLSTPSKRADSLTLFAACSLYFGWKGVSKNSTSIKMLVFTARIKRMLVFSGAVLLALGICGAVLKGIGGITCIIALVVLTIFPELLCLISLFALKPCEKMIAKHYINDAKKILKSAGKEINIEKTQDSRHHWLG